MLPTSFWKDESFWLTLAAGVAAVLSSAGLGDLGSTAKAVIDGVAGLVATTYVGGSAHVKATTAKGTTPTVVPVPAVDVSAELGRVLTKAAADLAGK